MCQNTIEGISEAINSIEIDTEYLPCEELEAKNIAKKMLDIL